MPDLDLTKAAVGDPVRATLRADLRIGRQLLAPKGSVARGRIVRLDRYPTYFALQIEFQDLDWPGGHARLKLSFDQPAFATRLIGRAQDGAIADPAPSRTAFKRYPHVLEIGISDSSFERHRRPVRAGLRLFAKASAQTDRKASRLLSAAHAERQMGAGGSGLDALGRRIPARHDVDLPQACGAEFHRSQLLDGAGHQVHDAAGASQGRSRRPRSRIPVSIHVLPLVAAHGRSRAQGSADRGRQDAGAAVQGKRAVSALVCRRTIRCSSTS